jgi:hypothetical protein
MDYMAELAEHPDALEALTLLHADVIAGTARVKLGREAAAPLKRLIGRYKFLRDEHPHTWITQLIHTFYNHPPLAAATWKYLRYCTSYCLATAELLLIEKRRWRFRQGVPREILTRVPDEFDEAYRRGNQPNAIRALAMHLRTERDSIDMLCKQTRLGPTAPEFIADLLNVERVVTWNLDDRTQALLASPDAVRESAKLARMAVPFSIVLDRELDQIGKTREAVQRSTQKTPRTNQHPLRRAIDSNLVGLAFSGGGIRSATFNLGVLQALSRFCLLKQFDYLSTVSGGGYIGSWFAAWMRRESCGRIQDDTTQGTLRFPTPAEAADEMQRRLSPTRSPNPMDEREKPIRYLREYSNYLTPRAGLMSADTWTMLGIYLRNTLLNQVIIVSLLAAALLVPRDWFAFVEWFNRTGPWDVVAASFCLLLGVVLLVANLRRLEPRPSVAAVTVQAAADASLPSTPPWYATPSYIQSLVVAPWLVGAGLLMHRYGRDVSNKLCVPHSPSCGIDLVSEGPLGLGFVTVVVLGSCLALGKAHRSWTTGKDGFARVEAMCFAAITIASAAIMGGVIATSLGWVVINAFHIFARVDRDALLWHFTILGPAAVLSVFSIAIIGMLGILGRRFPDEHREWWSRLRTFIHVWSILSAAWSLVALYVPWGVYAWKIGWPGGITAFGTWIGSTIFGVMKGQTAEEDRKRLESSSALTTLPDAAVRIAAFVAPYLCITGLLVCAAIVIDAVYFAQLTDKLPKDAHRWYWLVATWSATAAPSSFPNPGIPWTPAWTAVLLVISLVFSWRVDVNEFSIHHFYRNRLVRCYLGASHKNRKADWFTGFDTRDEIPLRSFDASDTTLPLYPGPYPILNCALNLVGGQDLAWQERKATSFVFTPRFCGYDVDRAVLRKMDASPQSSGYVPTATYHNDDEGPPLGMAMAISGAAANPNMGRATTPAAAFLMTVFNVRLGWWIKNPRHATARLRPSPKFGLTYTGLELFGGTNDSRKYVNLSDGGHFDNLGVYELIRRGCRYIIVSDAGQDAEMTCEDLGNLVRKCRTDFGVEIEIPVDQIRDRKEGISAAHCVVGVIHYLNIPRRKKGVLVNDKGGPLKQGDRSAHEQGYLVYIKPSMTGDEPQDVQEYNRRIPEFPHQSTADQWFNESQFESYRKLGMHVGEELLRRVWREDSATKPEIPELFENLYEQWGIAATSTQKNATGTHTVPPPLAASAEPTANDNANPEAVDSTRSKMLLSQG